MRRSALLLVGGWLLASASSNGEMIQPVKAAVFRSTGTQFLGQTIWPELNSGWSQFGNVPVEIDWSSLAGSNITDAKLEASGADVIILSNPAFVTYTSDEIAALKRYVEAGHGLIISYGKFRSEDRALAPLVGLSETTQVGTNTWLEHFTFDILSDHPVFQRLGSLYLTGALELASPTPYGTDWQRLPGSTLLAAARPEYAGWVGNGAMIANDTAAYRGLYFSHYPENRSGGTNLQDMQVFYNSLLWTAGVPEPSMAGLLAGAGLLVLWRGRKTPHKC